jgi:hypothetical protein
MRFGKPFLFVVPAVGLVRLALSLSGVPNDTTKLFSMTVLVWIAVFYLATRDLTYKQLLFHIGLVNLSAQLVSVLAIAIAIFSGNGNVFSAPEFAFGSDGRTWAHLLAHLFVGIPVGTLVGWAIGSLVLAGRNAYARNQRVSHV